MVQKPPYLNSRGIANKSSRNRQSFRGNVTNSSFDIVWNPVNKKTVNEMTFLGLIPALDWPTNSSIF
jgi:hypothetical protein